MQKPRKIELLAPARDAEIAIEAIRHGADAVYMGAESHGARSAAGNSLSDIARVVEYAHQFGVRVYVTVNTIVYENELAAVERMVADLYRIGVDALIVQDMSLLEMDLPPIALHASTQCDIRDEAKARFLADAGFSQLVLARELGIDEIARIHSAVNVSLEAFVHGALCVSYSGDCQAGYALQGRSANRGECPQICRHAFDLVTPGGDILVKDKYLLSLRDLNRSEYIGRLMTAGVSSFKIEGRLKDAAYVKNVVAAYRIALDSAIAAASGKYVRSSVGESRVFFTPDLNQSFNRGYTAYFTDNRRPEGGMASLDTPKWIGVAVGKVISCSPRQIRAKLTAELSNGDGLGYFDSAGRFCGFRLNRVDRGVIYPAAPVEIAPGTILFRNHDKALQDRLSGDTATRKIPVLMTLRSVGWGISLDVADAAGHSASVTQPAELQEARTSQIESRRKILSRTGDTIFEAGEVFDDAGNLFIPNSMLADMRRRVLDSLLKSIRISHDFDYYRGPVANPVVPEPSMTYHANVANSLAERFYRSHGAAKIAPALEAGGGVPPVGTRVMNTRYCIRREMGRCLRTAAGRRWAAGPLYLRDGKNTLKVEFDCARCEMNIYTQNVDESVIIAKFATNKNIRDEKR